MSEEFPAFSTGADYWRATVAEAKDAPIPEGERSALMMRHGTMSLRYYAPTGSDPQVPHDQDEIYIVISGTGNFVNGDSCVPFGPGDALFAPAGVVHRFLDFTPDFSTWVVFYGATDGEAPPASASR